MNFLYSGIEAISVAFTLMKLFASAVAPFISKNVLQDSVFIARDLKAIMSRGQVWSDTFVDCLFLQSPRTL